MFYYATCHGNAVRVRFCYRFTILFATRQWRWSTRWLLERCASTSRIGAGALKHALM